jgi:hypothetical protein
VSFPGSGNPAWPGLSPLEGIILFHAKAAARLSWIHPCRPVPAWDFFRGLCLSARLLFRVRLCAKGARFFLLFGPRAARCLGDFVFQQQRQLRVLLRQPVFTTWFFVQFGAAIRLRNLSFVSFISVSPMWSLSVLAPTSALQSFCSIRLASPVSGSHSQSRFYS